MNTKAILVILASVGLWTNISQAQETTSKHEHNAGFAIGNGNELTALRAEYTRYWGLGEKGRFKIGAGGRVAYGFGSDLRAAEVNTSNNGDGGTDQPAITVGNFAVAGINTVVGIKYQLAERWDVGLRFDLVGVGFGASDGGTYSIPNSDSTLQVGTKAPNPNIAFTRGQVMSDNLWVGYTLKEQHQLYLSFAFYGTEYELEENNAIDPDDPRFERIHQMLFVGYNFRF